MLNKPWLTRGLPLLFFITLILLVYLSQRESYSPVTNSHIQQLQEKENFEILDVKMNNEVDKPFKKELYCSRGLC